MDCGLLDRDVEQGLPLSFTAFVLSDLLSVQETNYSMVVLCLFIFGQVS